MFLLGEKMSVEQEAFREIWPRTAEEVHGHWAADIQFTARKIILQIVKNVLKNMPASGATLAQGTASQEITIPA